MGNIKTGEGFKASPAQQVVLDLTNDPEANVLLVQAAITAAVLAAGVGDGPGVDALKAKGETDSARIKDLETELQVHKAAEAEVFELKNKLEAEVSKRIDAATDDLKAERDGLLAEVVPLRESIASLTAEMETMKAKSLSPEAAEKAVKDAKRK